MAFTGREARSDSASAVRRLRSTSFARPVGGWRTITGGGAALTPRLISATASRSGVGALLAEVVSLRLPPANFWDRSAVGDGTTGTGRPRSGRSD
jgi:hypothetical protein